MSFGSFGGGSGFNSSSIFGSSSNTTQNQFRPTGSIFGGTPTTTTAATASPLGSTATSSPFSSGFGGFSSTTTTAQPTSGTTIKFIPFSGQDTISKNGVTQTINTNHQCITAMKDYESKSLEELRWEDYQANRKFPAQQSSQFGTSLFSTSTTTPANTSFSGGTSGGLFGSTQPNKSIFGATSTTTTTPSTGGIFGSQTSTTNKFGFGSTGATTSGASSPFSTFGGQTTTGSVFGGTQATQPASTGGIFGGLGSQNTTLSSGGGIFGGTSTATTSGGGIFGSTQPKPTGFAGFGQTTATTTTTQPAFSFGGGTTQPATTTPSIFGQTQTQSPLAASRPFGSTLGGGFGSTTTPTSTGFGAATTTTAQTGGIFGSPAAQPQQNTTFGGLGGTSALGGGGFGGFGSTQTQTATTTPSTGIFGGFGATSTTPQQTASTSSPFGAGLGATSTTTGGFGSGATSSGGIFGGLQTQTQNQPAASAGGIFGGQTSTGFGSGIRSTTGFGQATTAASQPSLLGGSGLGGGTGLTGSTSSGGIFGQTQTQAQGSLGLGLGAGGSSLSGGFSSTGFSFASPTNQASLSTSGFGAGLNPSLTGYTTQQAQQGAQTQPLAQQQLLASLSNAPYGTANLLRATIQDLNKKDDILKPVSSIAQRPYITEATSPAKVVSSEAPSSTGPYFRGGLSQSIKITPKALNTISLNKKPDLFEGLENEEVPCFYPRKNIKKLMFKPQSENLSQRSSANSSVNGDVKIDFMRKAGPYQDETLANIGSFTAAQITTDSTNVSDDGVGDNQSEISNQPHQPHPANIVLDRPGYFTIPSMQDLGAMTDAKGDCNVENFAIGRVDYGCITFPGFTNLANMNLDEIIHIRRKEVHVYPDDTKKPPVGQGLNKPAEVTLHRIWPTDKQTKSPITDPERIIMMGYNKKLESATVEMGAQFIDYDPVTGSWTFKVKHFSKYGLHDSDDEDEEKVSGNVNNLSKNSELNSVPVAQAQKAATAGVASSLKLVLEPDNDKECIKQEKDMIQKQLKLIEARRMELQAARKTSSGNNLNVITNQQWEMINEYVPNVPGGGNKNKISYPDHSNLHLELSSDSGDENEDNDDLDRHSYSSNKDNIRKLLILDADNETDDNEMEENKENDGLYPNLSEFKKGKKQSATKSKAKIDKIYPNLNGINETYTSREYNIRVDIKEKNRLEDDVNIKEEQADDLPFVDRFSTHRGNKYLVDAFFSEDRDADEFFLDNQDNLAPKLGQFGPTYQQTKPIGLLKRGLGGISNLNQDNTITLGDVNTMSTSLRGDQFHGQAKVSKTVSSSLSMADVQQKIGSRTLKPKLWNRFLMQKTSQLGLSKESEEQDQLEDEKTQFLSTDKRLQSLSLGPESTVKFIKLVDSIGRDLEWCLADAGLFNSRRFRINWSMQPTALSYVQLAPQPKNTTFLNVAQFVSPLTINSNLLDSSKLALIQEHCEKYLRVQLELSESASQSVDGAQKKYLLNTSANKLPFFRPKNGNELIKKCCECAKEIRNVIGDHPDADNADHAKMVWNLCQSLWGDVPDNYKTNPNDASIGDYELEQIRKRLLSEWLADVSSHRIERECKMVKFNKNKENYLSSIFSLLTGNRVLDACLAATENQDFRLALLLSQSSGGNDVVRAMIKKQLYDWHTSNSDKYLNIDRIKFYLLVSGDLTYNLSNSSSHSINVCENLDWKRQFALILWYHCLPIHSINDALIAFEKCLEDSICNKPVPPYVEDSVQSSSLELNSSIASQTLSKSGFSSFLAPKTPSSGLFKLDQRFKSVQRQPRDESLYDTCYHLMKLYCNNNHPIEDIIHPLNHTSNQLDFRLSWHLAMSLLALQYNHATKVCVDSLHDSYAMQLQSIGLWHWSVFIIMHIQDEKRRETYVRTYLSKYVTSQRELSEKEAFLIEKLNIPFEWVYEYKALRAKYEGLHDNQFELLLKAHKWNEAHCILIELLAPDLFIKQNLKTLNHYLNTLSKESQSINKWNSGGQVYLDYIKLNQKAESLFDFSSETIKEKLLDDDILKELNHQLISLSSRLKEFDSKSSKKLLCVMTMSKLLLKFFNVFSEVNNNELEARGEMGESIQQEEEPKTLNKSIIERACQLTDTVPETDLMHTMLLKKSKYTHDFLSLRRR